MGLDLCDRIANDKSNNIGWLQEQEKGVESEELAN